MIHERRPQAPQKGDFLVFAADDLSGRENRGGRHTNFGYSGYVVATVFDGRNFARLTRKCLEGIGIDNNAYDFRYDAPAVKGKIIERLAAFAEQSPDFRVKSWWYRGSKYAILVSQPSGK